MNVFINYIDEKEIKRILITVQKESSVETMNASIQKKTGILPSHQYIYLGDPYKSGKLLSNTKSIGYYKITDNSDLYMLVFFFFFFFFQV